LRRPHYKPSKSFRADVRNILPAPQSHKLSIDGRRLSQSLEGRYFLRYAPGAYPIGQPTCTALSPHDGSGTGFLMNGSLNLSVIMEKICEARAVRFKRGAVLGMRGSRISPCRNGWRTSSSKLANYSPWNGAFPKD